MLSELFNKVSTCLKNTPSNSSVVTKQTNKLLILFYSFAAVIAEIPPNKRRCLQSHRHHSLESKTQDRKEELVILNNIQALPVDINKDPTIGKN